MAEHLVPRHVDHEGFPLKKDHRVSLFHRLTRNRVGLLLFALYMLVFSMPCLSLAVIASAVLLQLNLVKHIYMRRFFDFSIGTWLFFMAHSMEMFLGIKSRMFGHRLDFDDRCVLLMNHRCHFDWLFFFSVMAKQGELIYWTVIQRRINKFVPILGWCMQFRNHFFITRQWKKDQKEFAWKLSYINHTDSPYQLLMFPEGTDLTPEHKAKYDLFADANSWPRYDYCLHPKSTGFIYTLNALRKHKIDSVYDVTIGYPDIFAKTEYDLVVEGRIPKEVHYHIVRYDIADLPTTNEGLEQWLRDRWREKEERLRLFYTHREFKATEFDKKMTNQGNKGVMEVPQRLKWRHLLRSAVYVVLFVVLSSMFMYTFPVIGGSLWLMGTVFSIYLTLYTEGIDYFVMKCYKRDYNFLPSTLSFEQ